MLQLPNSLEEATQQAIASTFAAIDAGISRLLVDMRFTELKPLPIARTFADQLQERYGNDWLALFADAGAAALARRDWSDLEIAMRGISEAKTKIEPEHKAFLLVAPSSVEVEQVEKLLQIAGDRPFIMLNPRLENSEVGIGLATRDMRKRFLDTFTTCYYIKPLAQGALWRRYPDRWQVLRQDGEDMRVLRESEERPNNDDMERLFLKATGKKTPFLDRMQQFLNALGR